MLAASKPRSMNTLRAPSRIGRRFEESSSVATSIVFGMTATIGLSSRQRFQPAIRIGRVFRLMVQLTEMYLDRTVRSMVIIGSDGAFAAGVGLARIAKL